MSVCVVGRGRLVCRGETIGELPQKIVGGTLALLNPRQVKLLGVIMAPRRLLAAATVAVALGLPPREEFKRQFPTTFANDLDHS